jgi:hypothetical protein
MRFPGKATIAGLSLSLTAGTAWAADVCARAPDLVALQVSALQQQLMVAALTCDDVPLYNNFVTAYQKDLVASDEALQAFFDRFGSEEGTPAYHSFKTKMANLYSARSASDKKRFCTNVRAIFGPALKTEKMSLAAFAMSQPSTVSEPYTNCGETVAGGAMVTRTPVVAPTPPSNLLIAQNAAAEAKGAAIDSANAAPPADTPLSAALTATPPSTSAVAAAETKQTAQLNNSQAANSVSNQQPNTTTSGRTPYYQGYGVGYARERERARQQAAARQENDTTKAAEAANTGDPAATANSNQQREVTRPAPSRSASEAYRERLAQQRAQRERAAQRPSVRYRDRYDARGYYWPADPYWQYCYTRYGVRLSCAEAAQRFRADRYYYRAPYDAGGYYPSR